MSVQTAIPASWAIRKAGDLSWQGYVALADKLELLPPHLQDAVDRGWLRVNRTTGASVAVGPGSEANMRAVLSTAREMASALSFLHARGIVHGDLSAWNVMLCTTGVGANDGGRGFIAKVSARSCNMRDHVPDAAPPFSLLLPPAVL